MCMMINSLLHCGLWLLSFVHTLADIIIIVLETTCTLWVGFFSFKMRIFDIICGNACLLFGYYDPGVPTVNNRVTFYCRVLII